MQKTLGELNLKIPKLGRGTFFPYNLLVRYSRTEKALAAAREMVVNSISTRKVDKVAKEMGVLSMSKSQVSRIIQTLDEEIDRLLLSLHKHAIDGVICVVSEAYEGLKTPFKRFITEQPGNAALFILCVI